MRLLVGVAIVLGCCALLLPLGYTLLCKPSVFTEQAFRPLVSISLEELGRRVRIKQGVYFPRREDLGAVDLKHRFIIVAAKDDRALHCWKDLDLSVKATISGKELTSASATGAPYIWSSSCTSAGIWFEGHGGEHVELAIEAPTGSRLPEGNLLMLPYWQSEAKDRLVSAMLYDSIARLSVWTTPAAVAAIVVGLLLIRSHPRRR